MPWTEFWDMHSGGSAKLARALDGQAVSRWDAGREAPEVHKVYIEASYEDAMIVFEELFGRDPHNITCHCCGPDYAVEESPTLEEATKFHRRGRRLEEFARDRGIEIVYRHTPAVLETAQR